MYITTLNLPPGPSTNPGSNTYEGLCVFRQKGAKFMQKGSKKSNSKLKT